MKYFLCMVICSWFLTMEQAYGQYHTQSKKAIKYFEKSTQLLRARNYSEAVECLKLALEKDPNFAEAHLRLGTNYLTIGDMQQARGYLEKAVQLIPDNPKTVGAYYALADMSFREGEYQRTLDYLQKFGSFNPPDRQRKSGERLYKSASFALEQQKNPLPFSPQPLDDQVNEFDLQYFPVLTADQQTLIFTRREGRDPQFDEDMVFSQRQPDGSWTVPESISDKINSKFNEGTCTISANGRTIIFTSCSGRRSMGSCDLYVSYKFGDEWTEPENMGTAINSRDWESQPSLSADGKTLYFVSDRRGGMGKRDIWVSNWQEGAWSKARNLGTAINTPEEEVSPFIHVNGQTLFFSSKGYEGMGGYDIYYSELLNGKWSDPKNLGYPINNNDDQVSLFITADGKRGYYSYEQKDQTNYKSLIYDFEVPEAIRVRYKSNYMAGKILDLETKQPLQARVELFDIQADSLRSVVTSDSISGEYVQILTEGSEYALYVSKPGYLFESLSFDYQESRDREPIHIDVYLKPIKAGLAATLNNIFFDIDQYQLKEKSKTELNKSARFLKENPQVRVEISGHTDNSGSVSHNQKLSLNRARAVYRYLIEAGIDADRLTFKGYGSSVPVAPNDTEANRQLNRRIEFKIL